MSSVMTDWAYYSLASDAIKIGLGALIAGVSSYAIARVSRHTELGKIREQKRIELLLATLSDATAFFSAFHHFHGFALGKIRTGIPIDPRDAINAADVTLREAKGRVDLARAQVTALDVPGAREALTDGMNAAFKFRDEFMLNERTFTLEQAAQIDETVQHREKDFMLAVGRALSLRQN